MKNTVISILLGLLSVNVLGGTENADDILRAAEYIRNPTVDYEVDVKLVDEKKGTKENRAYKVSLKGDSKALVKFTAPAVDRGTKVLMVENDMWIAMPTTAKPLRIAPREKVTGNAAYGDITRLSFVRNYTPKILREDKIENKPAYVLDLRAIEGRPVTYDRVEYWVEKGSHKPLKALYMTDSGKVLKEGYFEKYVPFLGINRPTHFLLIDHFQTDHKTTLIFVAPKKSSLPDLLFEKQNFGRDS